MDINYLSILVAAIAAFVVGFLWYGKALFGKAWIRLAGWTPEELEANKKKGMGRTMVMAFIALLVIAYVLAYTLNLLGISSIRAGLGAAFWLWLGFTAAPLFMNKLFGKNKSTALFLIDSGHYLAVFLVMSVILTLWK